MAARLAVAMGPWGRAWRGLSTRKGPPDPHAVLGVRPGASPREIRAAFLARCKEVHPDGDPSDPSRHGRFLLLAEAYAALSAPRAPGSPREPPGPPRERPGTPPPARAPTQLGAGPAALGGETAALGGEPAVLGAVPAPRDPRPDPPPPHPGAAAAAHGPGGARPRPGLQVRGRGSRRLPGRAGPGAARALRESPEPGGVARGGSEAAAGAGEGPGRGRGRRGGRGGALTPPFLPSDPPLVPPAPPPAAPPPPRSAGSPQRGVSISAFCKDFNERTRDIKPGVPLRVRLLVHPDRTYSLTIGTPPTSYFLKAVAGVEKGSSRPGHEPAGVVSLAQLYEVAVAKQKDPAVTTRGTPLPALVGSLVGSARSLGLHVVPRLTPQAVAEVQRRRQELEAAAAAPEGQEESEGGARKK